MIHGRFQPFHNGHLEYMRGAADRSDELWIGILRVGGPGHDAA